MNILSEPKETSSVSLEPVFNAFRRRYQASLYRFFYRHLASWNVSGETVNDLASEVWIKIWVSRSQMPLDDEEFKRRMYRIATNVMIDYLRKPDTKYAYRGNSLDDEDFTLEAVDGCDVVRQVEVSAMCEAILKAADRLPGKSRRIALSIIQDVLEGRSPAEAYDEMVRKFGEDVTRESGKTAWFRSCRTLRQVLEKELK